MTESVLNIERLLGLLAAERHIFHSEADFQHALAWEIHKQFPIAKIRLEVPSKNLDKREHIDIVINIAGRKVAFELKYKTRKLNHVSDDEQFSLYDHRAHDIGRYDFIKDVVRLERCIFGEQNAVGHALFLTNDELYWKESVRGINSADFFLHEGRVLDSGVPLVWHQRTGLGTMKNRNAPLCPGSTHVLHWANYSTIPGSQFRYLLLTIAK
jgi:hypothetical protein